MIWAKRSISVVLPFLLPGLAVVLASCSKEEPAATELAALEAAYDESELERQEKQEAFIPQYEALVEEYWGTEAALDAKLWLMSRTTRSLGEEEKVSAVAEYTDAIFERYARSPHMEKLGQHLSSYTEEQRDQYFGDLRENSPHAGVRAAAIYYPARSRHRSLRRVPEEEVAKVRAEINAELELLTSEYADVPKNQSTYGIVADALLNAHTEEELAIGQPAPEIIGRTAAGDEIRLSDFLGKVTVIDFWGDW